MERGGIGTLVQVLPTRPVVWVEAQGSSSGVSQTVSFAITAGSSGSEAILSSPAAGKMGMGFIMESDGFKAGEKVTLWTTDPKGKALDAKFLLSDSKGKIKIKVETNDPEGLLDDDGTNATKYVVEYDDDGNVTDRYLRVVLAKPTVGAWFVSSKGSTTGANRVFTFTIS